MAKQVRWTDDGIVEVCVMQDAETILAIYRGRGQFGKPLEGIYRQLFNPDLFLRAYGRLYRNAGAMTRGTSAETVDGMSMERIKKIIELLKYERFRWSPVRRVLIPKGSGKTRPLGIPNLSPDRMLQEVMRSLLDAYYEPQFSPNSHGFRPGRGCHTALRDIYRFWPGTKWFIEGDIRGCFDNIDHMVLTAILREKIHDGRFLTLVEGLLQAGYLEEWYYRPTLSGTPQGGVASPLLANIYLDKLDKFVEMVLVPEYTRGKRRKRDPAYREIEKHIGRIRRQDKDHEDLPALYRLIRHTRASLPVDPGYRRLRYIRYADDFLLGVIGPKMEAEAIKDRVAEFLRDQLKLELSPEKTLITHALTEQARFLGYDIAANRNHYTGKTSGYISLRLPPKKLKEKIRRYTRNGKPTHRSELINESDFAIVDKYGAEYRGIVQYYAHAHNRWWLHDLQWTMEISLLKTLARKHKSTVRRMYHRFLGKVISKHGVRKCLSVTIAREGKKPLYTQFGGISLKVEPFAEIEDILIDQDRHAPRCELIDRLKRDICELCGSREDVQVHHIRKLSDLKVKGRKEKPTWLKTMAAMRRKTLIVCRECHERIHAGRPTRTAIEG